MNLFTRTMALMGIGLIAALLHSWAWPLAKAAPTSTAGVALGPRQPRPAQAPETPASDPTADPDPDPDPDPEQTPPVVPPAQDDPCAGVDLGGIVGYELSLAEARCFHAYALDGEAVVFLDARASESQYADAHLPGAIRLSSGMVIGGDPAWFEFFETRPPELNEWIVIYCSGGDCDESHNLRDQLAVYGYTATYIFVGGMEAWNDAGLPVATGDAP